MGRSKFGPQKFRPPKSQIQYNTWYVDWKLFVLRNILLSKSILILKYTYSKKYIIQKLHILDYIFIHIMEKSCFPTLQPPVDISPHWLAEYSQHQCINPTELYSQIVSNTYQIQTICRGKSAGPNLPPNWRGPQFAQSRCFFHQKFIGRAPFLTRGGPMLTFFGGKSE